MNNKITNYFCNNSNSKSRLFTTIWDIRYFYKINWLEIANIHLLSAECLPFDMTKHECKESSYQCLWCNTPLNFHRKNSKLIVKIFHQRSNMINFSTRINTQWHTCFAYVLVQQKKCIWAANYIYGTRDIWRSQCRYENRWICYLCLWKWCVGMSSDSSSERMWSQDFYHSEKEI